MGRGLSKEREKFCNICGESVLIYTVMDNAPLCNKCVPVKEVKKIMNESQMLDKILKGEKKR